MSSVLQSTAEFLASSAVKRERLKFWGIKSGVSLVDQGLTSGASFVMNLLLARWLPAEGYGAFAVAFATLLFIAGFHNVLLLEPTSIFGPSTHAGQTVSYFRTQVKVHFFLTVFLSIVLLLLAAGMALFRIHRELVSATLGSGIGFPVILFLWLVRRMCYVVHRPAIAVWASAGYFVLLLAGLLALHRVGIMSPAIAMLVMAGASLAATIIPLTMLEMWTTQAENATTCRQVLRENWTYGRWLVASLRLQAGDLLQNRLARLIGQQIHLSNEAAAVILAPITL